MRYTLFIKLPNQPYSFKEGNDIDSYMREAKLAAEEHPEADITVCDRQTSAMIFCWKNGKGGTSNYSLRLTS